MQNVYCWSELKLSWWCVSPTLQYLKHDLTKRNWSQADFGCDWPRPLEQELSFDHICTVHLRQLHHHHKNLLFCFQQALNQPTCQDIDDDVAARRVVVRSLASTPHRAEHFRTRTPAGSISPIQPTRGQFVKPHPHLNHLWIRSTHPHPPRWICIQYKSASHVAATHAMRKEDCHLPLEPLQHQFHLGAEPANQPSPKAEAVLKILYKMALENVSIFSLYPFPFLAFFTNLRPFFGSFRW